MKLVQSNDTLRVFKTEFKKHKVILNIRKGGTTINCFITIDDLVIGRYDVTSDMSLAKAFKKYHKKFITGPVSFMDEEEFRDFFLRVGEKLMNNDYERETKSAERKLTNEARDFLKSKNLMDRMDKIQRKTTEDPLIGCHEELLIFNLVIVSCKTTKPITLEFTGPTSSGKTFPANHAVSGFPSSMIIAPTGDSKTAAKYDWDYYDKDTGEYVNETGNKCIYFTEKNDSIEAVKAYKPMMSHDKNRLVFRVPQRDPVSGEMKTVHYVMDGIASFILLSVQHMDDEEMSTRTMKGSPIVTNHKTREIIKTTLESDSLHRVWKDPPGLNIMHDAMYNLQRYNTINIFSKYIAKIFPKDDMKRTRDMNRLRGLIRACTILHQFQRCTEVIDDTTVLYSSLEDNIIALSVMDNMLESTILGIPAITLRIYNLIKKMEEEEVELTPNNLHEWCELENIHQTMKTLKEAHLETLENHRFLKIKKFGTKSHERVYSLNKRYEDITKVPKLTPMFIKEIQDHYDDIVDSHRDIFLNIDVPDVKPPKNCPENEDNEVGYVTKYLFGFNYFDDDMKDSVVKHICTKDMSNILFNSIHIIDQEEVDISKSKEIKKDKKKALKEIKSGKSARQWKKISENDADNAYLAHIEEEEEKMREFIGDTGL